MHINSTHQPSSLFIITHERTHNAKNKKKWSVPQKTSPFKFKFLNFIPFFCQQKTSTQKAVPLRTNTSRASPSLTPTTTTSVNTPANAAVFSLTTPGPCCTIARSSTSRKSMSTNAYTVNMRHSTVVKSSVTLSYATKLTRTTPQRIK